MKPKASTLPILCVEIEKSSENKILIDDNEEEIIAPHIENEEIKNRYSKKRDYFSITF